MRNKFLIIIYRGKDFLPRGVETLVAEREVELFECQLQEEAARLKASRLMQTIETYFMDIESSMKTTRSGTLSEYKDIQSESAILKDGNSEINVELEAEKERLKKQLRNQGRKLHIVRIESFSFFTFLSEVEILVMNF